MEYANSATTPNTYCINKRVTGARLYYEDTTGDPGILYQLLEIDFQYGCKNLMQRFLHHGTIVLLMYLYHARLMLVKHMALERVQMRLYLQTHLNHLHMKLIQCIHHM